MYQVITSKNVSNRRFVGDFRSLSNQRFVGDLRSLSTGKPLLSLRNNIVCSGCEKVCPGLFFSHPEGSFSLGLCCANSSVTIGDTVHPTILKRVSIFHSLCCRCKTRGPGFLYAWRRHKLLLCTNCICTLFDMLLSTIDGYLSELNRLKCWTLRNGVQFGSFLNDDILSKIEEFMEIDYPIFIIESGSLSLAISIIPEWVISGKPFYCDRCSNYRLERLCFYCLRNKFKALQPRLILEYNLCMCCRLVTYDTVKIDFRLVENLCRICFSALESICISKNSTVKCYLWKCNYNKFVTYSSEMDFTRINGTIGNDEKTCHGCKG